MNHGEKESILGEISDIRALLQGLKPVPSGPVGAPQPIVVGGRRELHIF
jgi:hypothetical protein